MYVTKIPDVKLTWELSSLIEPKVKLTWELSNLIQPKVSSSGTDFV